MANVIDEDALERNRTPEQREALARLLKMAEEQGVKPITKEQLDAMASVWPEDESVDEFLEARERWRSESQRRELP
jgi:sugar (pentulose or hexulose) kinase